MLTEFITSVERQIVLLGPIEIIVGITISVVVTVFAFIRMVTYHNRARMIENVPTSKVRSASQGYVELIGQAELMDGPLIVSPLSGRQCLWFRYTIEEKSSYVDSKGNTRSSWHVIKEETSDELFLLQDETGRCIIDPDDAEVIVENKRRWHKRLSHPPRRYTEELISEAESLYAIGLFKTIGATQHKQQKEDVAMLLRQWKTDPNQLLEQYDSDGDGELSQIEWEQVRLAAERAVKRQLGHKEKLEKLNILKKSPHKNQSFIISTIAEDELVQRYKRHSLFALLIFLSLGSSIVWVINIRLGM